MKAEIQNLTNSLIEYTDYLQSLFSEENREVNHSETFFNFVKTDSDNIFATLKKWQQAVKNGIAIGELSTPVQVIDSTVDNMSTLIMHSYYKDVRRRRYIEIKKSCMYVFHLILKELDNE